MRRRFPPLNPLRAFEVTARHLSFTEAADELCVTQGAVSRQVKALEDHLGFTLFIRGSRGLQLTSEASHYAAVLSDALHRIETATDEIVMKRRLTNLTIKGYTSLLNRWLIPMLPDFQMAHPHILVKTLADTDNVDFSRDVSDVGIRYGTGHWRDTTADLLFRDELMPVCSPAFLESVGPLASPGDLKACRLLVLRKRRRDWTDWLHECGVKGLEDSDEVVFDELAVLLEAALAGQGVAIGQRKYIEHDLAAGRLVAPFDHVLRRQAGYFLVIPEDRIISQKIQDFRRWILSRTGTPARPVEVAAE